jgi:glucose/arabinose dehydrogenase
MCNQPNIQASGRRRWNRLIVMATAAMLIGGCTANDDPPNEALWQQDLARSGAVAQAQQLTPAQQRDLDRRAPILETPKPANAPGEPSAPVVGERPPQRNAAGQPLPHVPPPDPAEAKVPDGFRVEVVMSGLTYPTSVEFDDAGNLYVAEAGYSYGDPSKTPRVLRVSPDGKVEQVASQGLEGPVNDLLWHDGKLYISHRGKISVLEAGGKVRDLVTGLPSKGDHQNNQMAAGPDGKIYFGQGTATNSGVVGEDNAKMGWLEKHRDFHDTPARDIKIAGRTYPTTNPLSKMHEKVETSPFHPYGKAMPDGGTVKGDTQANGTILRMDPDGSHLEVYAWGLRNPFGVMWGPDGKLYATENGFDVRGSRPIANAKDNLWEIEQGAWYGWPDYSSGIPVTDPEFSAGGQRRAEFVMAEHPPVGKPLMTFPKHASVTKLDFAPSDAFGKGRMFVAFFGHLTPMTGTPPKEHGGHRVLAVDLKTKKVEEFFTKKEHGEHHQQPVTGPAGEEPKGEHDESVSPGPRRLVDVRFDPMGDALYVADFGSLVMEEGKPKPIPGTGVVWRISPTAVRPAGPPAGLAAPE